MLCFHKHERQDQVAGDLILAFVYTPGISIDGTDTALEFFLVRIGFAGIVRLQDKTHRVTSRSRCVRARRADDGAGGVVRSAQNCFCCATVSYGRLLSAMACLS